MQNHGGYGERYDNFNQEVYKVGASYTDANQYLSLLNESDKALENLITYFKGVDDPVEIVFFGDHQPGLCNDFIKLLNGKGNSGLTEQELENLYKAKWIKAYNILQYNSMFDEKDRSSLLFPYLK